MKLKIHNEEGTDSIIIEGTKEELWRRKMACKKCEEYNEGQKGVVYFRWKNANIGLMGCPEHLKEVMEVLRKATMKTFLSTEEILLFILFMMWMLWLSTI